MDIEWNGKLFTEPPQVWEHAGSANDDGVKAIFYENVSFKGRETRVFAYLGIPRSDDGRPVPGMVLVHGGGGSAFRRWVRYWNEHGYAALSMDWNGCISGNEKGDEQHGHEHHKWGGPTGAEPWKGLDEPIGDQWPYHAVAAIVRARTLLESLPEVDGDRIGLTGVSWGGYLTCIAAGVDQRFKFAAPVYGCGFVADHSRWTDPGHALAESLPDTLAAYDATWDPKNFLPSATMPFLFIDGTNDDAYPLDIVEKSRALVKAECTRVIIPRLPHGHCEVSEAPAELFAYADGLFGRGSGLARCRQFGSVGGNCAFEATFDMKGDAIASAALHYTTDLGETRKREWKSIPATVTGDAVHAVPPPGTTSLFLGIETERGLRVTSDTFFGKVPTGGLERQSLQGLETMNVV